MCIFVTLKTNMITSTSIRLQLETKNKNLKKTIKMDSFVDITIKYIYKLVCYVIVKQ